MEKRDVIAFFDRCAPSWDAEMVRSDAVIRRILENAGVGAGTAVLDVACGTGVLFPDYLRRGASVTGVDISPGMVKIARAKFPAVPVLCGDIETLLLNRKFDCAMVYNAFPHFPEPGSLIAALAGHLTPGGRLSVAHGMSREQINRHHQGGAREISAALMSAPALAALMRPLFEVDVVVSDDTMYQVCGVLRPVER